MEQHFYKQLKIENFRGIKSLEIDDLAQVNLFVGRNNCGKTSLLESIFLLTGMSDPIYHIDYIEGHRGLIFDKNSDLKNFFYNQKYTEGFRLFGKDRTGNREINVVPTYGSFNRDKGTARTGMPSSTTEQLLNGLKFIFTHPAEENRQYKAIMNLARAGDVPFNFQPDEDYKETTNTCFLGQTYGPEMVDRMLNEKRKDILVKILQSIDPKVQDIRIGLNGVVMIDIGSDNFLPINHLGGGMVHILNILSIIYWVWVRNGILVIDEIENGLHVSSIKHMWDMVLEAAKQNHIQIFMATHSSDVIEGLSMALQDKSDSVACFWLHKFDDDRIKAYRYSPDGIKNALDVGIDIRH